MKVIYLSLLLALCGCEFDREAYKHMQESQRTPSFPHVNIRIITTEEGLRCAIFSNRPDWGLDCDWGTVSP